MDFQFFLCKHIALGQKSGNDPGPYGRGFNYQVEVGFHGGERATECEQRTEQVLKQIDHRFLGLDLDLGADPSTAKICRWIFDEIAKSSKVSEVRLLRGDGLICSYGVQANGGGRLFSPVVAVNG